jgi:hypothetical protein
MCRLLENTIIETFDFRDAAGAEILDGSNERRGTLDKTPKTLVNSIVPNS